MINNNINEICEKIKSQGYYICKNYISNVENSINTLLDYL